MTTPEGARSLNDLSTRLECLRSTTGVSYRDLLRRVVRLRERRGSTPLPSYNTVYRCLQPGRTRLDVDLVVDIATALTDEAATGEQWRRAYEAIADRLSDAQVVDVLDRLRPTGPGFVGRRDELTRLVPAVDGAATVHLLDGMPGVGKTWLAREAALAAVHTIRPDIVLAADLRGHHPHRFPADPAALLGELLRVLEVPTTRVASLGLDTRVTLFRERLRDHHAVILLDDAADDDQIAPLLPGTPGSLVLVTSRTRLTRTPGTRHAVGVLSPEDSVRALRRVIGGECTDPDEDRTLTMLADAVAHLPLALALVGSRVRDRPDWRLADHLDRVVEGARVLRIEQGVELAIASSYRALDEPTRAMLRALSAHPGRQIGVGAAAALADVSREVAGERLTALGRASLVSDPVDGHVGIHDLVRLYAAAQAIDEDPTQRRQAARSRLCTYFAATAALAMDLWNPAQRLDRPAVEPDGVALDPLTTPDEALAWLDAERTNLIAVALRGDPTTAGPPAALLSEVLGSYLFTRGRYREADVLHTRAAEVATGATRGRILMMLAGARHFLGLDEEAVTVLRQAKEIARTAGDLALEAKVATSFGIITMARNRWHEAEQEFLRALHISVEVDNPVLRMNILNYLGTVADERDRPEEALRWFEEARELDAKIGARGTAAHAISNIAGVLEGLGRYDEALTNAREYLTSARAVGHRPGEAHAIAQIARLTSVTGTPADAVELHLAALRIARETGDSRMVGQIELELEQTKQRLGKG